MEASMTREDLAEKLDRLDPGGKLSVPEDLLAPMFGAVTLSYGAQDPLRAIAGFALEHRCSFSFHQHEGAVPCFEKDDVF
jgi:hypothetical protein